MLRKIHVSNRHTQLKYPPRSVHRLFKALDYISIASIPIGELSVAFLTDEAICRLHEIYLNDPTPTDVITFPGDPAFDFAGEICVSVDCAQKSADHYHNTFGQELTLYLIHGWLHLAGYDDKTEKQSLQIRAMEKRLLNALDVSEWPAFTL